MILKFLILKETAVDQSDYNTTLRELYVENGFDSKITIIDAIPIKNLTDMKGLKFFWVLIYKFCFKTKYFVETMSYFTVGNLTNVISFSRAMKAFGQDRFKFKSQP